MRLLAALLGSWLLASCGGGGGSAPPAVTPGYTLPPVTPAYTLGGSITGLGSATGLTLVNGAEALPIAADATVFTFAAKLVQNATYAIAVGTQPNGLTCDIANGSGTIADANVVAVKVTCAYRTIVSTLAGTGSPGFANGTGTAASFYQPSGVAVDSSGNVFVTDMSNQAIRKITSAGVVSTFAGTGSPGFANGTGTAASFYYPQGVAVDSGGNVFVADTSNYSIRKITPSGEVSTFAGTGSPGFVNGTGTAASFGYPTGVAVDSSGNVFVVDYSNHAIRKITHAGEVSTLAGTGSPGFANGTGTAASFNYPQGVAVDSSNNVLVADLGNHAIRKITSSGMVSTLAGTGIQGFVNGTGTAASFYSPQGVAVDSSGNVVVADKLNHAIRKITPSGVVTTLAGTGSSGFVNGTGTAVSFYYPQGVAVDSGGNVFVADLGNHAIRKMEP